MKLFSFYLVLLRRGEERWETIVSCLILCWYSSYILSAYSWANQYNHRSIVNATAEPGVAWSACLGQGVQADGAWRKQLFTCALLSITPWSRNWTLAVPQRMNTHDPVFWFKQVESICLELKLSFWPSCGSTPKKMCDFPARQYMPSPCWSEFLLRNLHYIIKCPVTMNIYNS
jgi:hypothetical protein